VRTVRTASGASQLPGAVETRDAADRQRRLTPRPGGSRGRRFTSCRPDGEIGRCPHGEGRPIPILSCGYLPRKKRSLVDLYSILANAALRELPALDRGRAVEAGRHRDRSRRPVGPAGSGDRPPRRPCSARSTRPCREAVPATATAAAIASAEIVGAGKGLRVERLGRGGLSHHGAGGDRCVGLHESIAASHPVADRALRARPAH
jgi:hypothetical protein